MREQTFPPTRTRFADPAIRDKERASDEKAIEKLYRDINSGMLRRKRGADFDLSDSDDDMEARRRRKRREFQRMRKALLENESLGKIAEDPKKLAFLRAIEDRDDDQDMDILERGNESSQDLGVQEVPDSQPEESKTATLKRKRPLGESRPDGGNRAPGPGNVHRTKKPSTLAEIRESVSFLVEEPSPQPFEQSPDPSDAENGVSGDGRPTDYFAARRRQNPIVDRISLKRAASDDTSGSRLAFHHPDSGPTPRFRVPGLLRRATTQVTGQDRGTASVTERAAGGGEKGDFIRRGGTKKSSINYFAREAERRRVVDEVEKRREEGRMKIAGARRGVLGLLAGGRFD
jgi:mediator of replication checkpoint protein 1